MEKNSYYNLICQRILTFILPGLISCSILFFVFPQVSQAAIILDTRSSFSATSTPFVSGAGGADIDISLTNTSTFPTQNISTSTVFVYTVVQTSNNAQTCPTFQNIGGSSPQTIQLQTYTGSGSSQSGHTVSNSNSSTLLTDGICETEFQNTSFTTSQNLNLQYYTTNDSAHPYNTLNMGGAINGYNEIYGTTYVCIDNDGVSCQTQPYNPPTIAFSYPVANSTTPPFSPWMFTLTNLTSTDVYYARVNWQQIQYGTGPSYLNLPQGYFQIFGDQGNSITGGTTSTYPIVRPDRNLNYPDDGNTADVWTATAYLFDSTIGGGFISSSTEQFTLDRYLLLNGIKTQGTSTYISPFLSASGTILIATGTNGYSSPVSGASTFNASSSCPNDSLGLCSVMMFMFNPSYFSGQSTAPLMTQGVNALASSTPFAVVFQTVYSVEGAVSSTPTALNASYQASFGSVTGTVAFLTSSTGDIAFGSNFQTTFFPYEDDAMYLLTLAVLFFTPYHWWRKKHHAQKI